MLSRNYVCTLNRPSRCAAVNDKYVAAAVAKGGCLQLQKNCFRDWSCRVGAISVWSLPVQHDTPLMLLEDGHQRPITAMAFGNRTSDLLITASKDAVRRWRISGGEDNGAALAAELEADEPAAVCLDAEDKLVAIASGCVIFLIQDRCRSQQIQQLTAHCTAGGDRTHLHEA